MPSPALSKFSNRILEVKRLLSLCAPEDADYRIRKENVSRDEALLRGSLVLLCSHMEGYFEDLVSDAIDAFDKLASSVSLVPDALRAHQVMGTPGKWDVKDPGKRWEAVQQSALHPLIDGSAAKVPGCMESSLHTDGFSNPGTTEIEGLFKTVGVADVWAAFEAHEPDPIYRKSMDIIVHRRNQIAHGKADATITLADLKLYVERAERITEVFDWVTSALVNSCLTIADCWIALETAAAAPAEIQEDLQGESAPSSGAGSSSNGEQLPPKEDPWVPGEASADPGIEQLPGFPVASPEPVPEVAEG